MRICVSHPPVPLGTKLETEGGGRLNPPWQDFDLITKFGAKRCVTKMVMVSLVFIGRGGLARVMRTERNEMSG